MIVALYKEATKEVSMVTGVKLRTEQRWVENVDDGGGISLLK